ncbi:MAG: nucleotidyltransferase domain-containing protein [Desulfobulbaceae bacterium]|nr:nucleotidyltransferase domain-containing protein [Desulfobulbaceae bacterium]
MVLKCSGQDVLAKSRPNVSVLDFDRKSLLDRIRHEFDNRNVKEAYIFGSFARENENLWSDIDLLIVKDSSLPFIERPRVFSSIGYRYSSGYSDLYSRRIYADKK